jgi:hypothetical protein
MTPNSNTRRRVLLFFIDGIGVGPGDPSVNPLAADERPVLRLTADRTPESARAGVPARAHGLDASLGVPGLPQSATGQTAILTGVNAPAAVGHHVSGLPGPTLRRILAERSLLKSLTEQGRIATFLNAFGPRFFEAAPAARRLSATTLATMAAGVPLRNWEDLAEGRAVVHDLTHWRMRDYGFDLPRREPEEAGAIIAREAMRADFSLFEYFETDRAAHAMDRKAADRCLSDLSAALETVLGEADLRELLVLVASDHGNLEDLRIKTHTKNPAFFAAWGAWDGLPEPRSLLDIAPLVREALGVSGDGSGATESA